MHIPMPRDRAAARCALCGDELACGQACYRINGEIICPDCLPEYACQVFAPYRYAAGEGWRP
ncbi:MAG: hypothetical protein E7426_01025 [Ruminococcaceae bacterium]|nr:hypothetical protein [Oscillospiraceae bacterium]